MSKIVLISPPAGRCIRYETQSGKTYVFSFDPANCSFERNCNNMALSFENGACIELTDFFTPGIANTLHFEFEDGNVLAGKDFYAAFAENLDTIVTG